LLFDTTGIVGEVAARLALEYGLRPILAGRDAVTPEPRAAELSVDCEISDVQSSIG